MVVKPKKPAAFLDRDGVLNRDHGYVYRPQDLEILPGVLEGLRLLKDKGYWLIVVSNQSGVARGLFSSADVEGFHRAMDEKFRDSLGFGIDAFYFCPHHPQGSVLEWAQECTCRKPKPGLIEQAARDFPIDWSRSFMVGDKASDIACAEAAGIAGIQIAASQYEAHKKPFALLTSLDQIGPVLGRLSP